MAGTDEPSSASTTTRTLTSLGAGLGIGIPEPGSDQAEAGRRIADALPIGLARVTADGTLIDANRPWYAIFDLSGVSRGARLADLPIGTLRPPGGAVLVEEAQPHARAARGETVVDEPLLLRRPDGTETALSVSASPVGAGTPDEIVLLVTDLTGTPGAGHRLGALFDRGDALILVTDHDDIYRDANPPVLDLLGYAREEFIGLPVDRVMLPARDEDEARRRFRREGRASGLYRLLRKDGGVVTIEMRIAADVVPDRHLGVGRDVTREVEALHDLERFQRRLDLIVDTVQTGFVVVEADGRVSFANPAALSLLAPIDRLGAPTLRRWLAASMDTPDDSDDVLGPLFDEDQPIEIAVRGPYGRRYDVRVSRRRSTRPDDGDEDGGDGGRLYAIEDRTMLNRSLRALQETIERQERAEAEFRRLDVFRDTLLSAVSHELRTPLTVIRGGIQTIRARELPDETRRSLLERIEENTERLGALLDDLLDLNRMRREEELVERAPTDVAALARGVVARIQDLSSRSIVVEGPEPLVVAVDDSKTERILTNLVINATRHTPPDATIWVRWSHDGVGLLLRVDDEGPGVPDDRKQAVFGLFSKGAADAASTGTGIGLALVREFAVLHDGRAWVEDRPGGGASFRVWLPALRGQEA